MENYERLDMEVIAFDAQDVIVTSEGDIITTPLERGDDRFTY